MVWSYNIKKREYTKDIATLTYGHIETKIDGIIRERKDEEAYNAMVTEDGVPMYISFFRTLQEAKDWCENFKDIKIDDGENEEEEEE